MKTKQKSILLATVAAGLLCGTVYAQNVAPAPITEAAPARPVFDPNQLPATRGAVQHFTLTPRGDVDGFILSDGTQVHLPPHLSTQLVAAVKIGSAVTVHGLRAAAIPMVAAMSVTDDATGTTVVDLGPPGGPGHGPKHGHGPDGPPPPPPGAAPSEVSGQVQLVLHGPRGEANGAMLADGTVLRLPPSEATRVLGILTPGQPIVADGPEISNDLGKVMDVRTIGPSRNQLTQIAAPPPHGPDGHRPPPRP